MGKLIFRVYKWIVFKLFQRKDMWTPQFARMALAHKFYFWLGYLAVHTFLFWHLFYGQFWQRGLAVLGIISSAWFIAHIITHIRQHPENLPNR